MASTSKHIHSEAPTDREARDAAVRPIRVLSAELTRTSGRTVHELFEAQVAQTPHSIAVIYGEQSLSYAQLNARANRLARYLRSWGVGPDQPVGICVERSLEMVVGLLGIFKAGAAYMPLDPGYPAERLAYMVDDARPQLVLTQSKLSNALPPADSTLIMLDALPETFDSYAEQNLSAGATADNPVYVIYTSGSTGKPKGTEMSHRSMVNLIDWHREVFGAGHERRVLQFAALSFDVAFQDTFTTLCLGDTLVLPDEWVRRDVRALAGLLRQQSIERLFVPPLILQSLAEHATGEAVSLGHLRDVITAGEQLRIGSEMRAMFAHLPQCRLHNHYGPTETHVVTALTLDGDASAWPALPSIGWPIANTQIHILDELRRPVPTGEIGELYIGGVGVARGYLRRPELTAQRFVADPFSDESTARLYKTGDLARLRADGGIDYLGRNDDQVKIRGFRIELGEIEVQLARHEQVNQVAVAAREDVIGERRLIAYISARGVAPNPDELRAHMRALVPEYMVPSAFVVLDEFPTTPSGKLDRRHLPAPTAEAFGTREYEPPQGVTEESIARIWQGLLRLERIGRYDNFFELGGDSLVIVRMLERLRQSGFGVDVRAVYANPCLLDLALAIEAPQAGEAAVPPNLIPGNAIAITPDMLTLVELDEEQIARIVQAVPGGAANIQDVYPLAPLQEGLLFHHLLNEEGGDTYIVTSLLRVSSRERLDAFISSLEEVMERHDVLRTLMLWEQLPRPVQVVCRYVELPVQTLQLSNDVPALQQLERWLQPGSTRLDLRSAPLLQLRIAADPYSAQWYVVMHLHHIVCDHESLETLFKEVACALEQAEPVKALPYRNHVAQTLHHARTHDAETFFRTKLADVEEPTAPFGLLDVRRDGAGIAVAERPLDQVLARRLRSQARRLGVSAATLFHTAWALVLARVSGRDDVVFGTLLLGRLQGEAGAQHILGMFMNTLPLRLRLRGLTVRELVGRTQAELVDLLEHEQASLAVAQRCSRVPGSVPLFSTLLNYRHTVASAEDDNIAPQVRMLRLVEWTNYPITCSVDDLGEGFVIAAKTDRRVEPQRLLSYLNVAVLGLLDALERAPRTAALSLNVLSEHERREVVETFNSTRAPFPDRTIHEIFEARARSQPDAIAIECRGESLSCSELNRKANQLARHLRMHGVGPDQVVGICTERSVETIVGLLAILKAGGAYLPLDPAYPADRLAQMLTSARPKLILTQQRLRGRFPEFVGQVVALDADGAQVSNYRSEDLERAETGLGPHHLAYVIYTSGSTGLPKGVMIEHGNVVSLWQGLETIYRESPCERVAINASLSFDASVKQLIQVLSGRTLILIPEETRADTTSLLDLLRQSHVHAIDCTPSQLRAWIAGGLLEDPASALRVVLIGGEPIDQELWATLASNDRIEFYNVYGPTECTVDATFARLRGDMSGPHIGPPMENKRVYVLDAAREPVPIGVVGEIYIGGPGVGRGYFEQPELTAQRFSVDPFAATSQRLYRTGDLGRWRADGAIEYFGRNDEQVKIRGFRIELGDIEAHLLRHEGVREAALLAREDSPGDKRLVAYIACNEPAPTIEALRAHMKAALPDYMVPSAFVTLPKLPLTPSGKLDRRALPMPNETAFARRQYEAPRGETEEILAGLWRDLLPVERIGRDEEFFDIGGHSLLAMQVIVRVRSLLSIQLPMTSLFDYPTVAQLGAHIEALRREQMMERLAEGGEDVQALLQDVASMSDSDVEELMEQLKRGAQ